ncbi:hypothetical protein ACWGKQ_08670 [Streptomyces sp. NPDC054770]
MKNLVIPGLVLGAFYAGALRQWWHDRQTYRFGRHVQKALEEITKRGGAGG